MLTLLLVLTLDQTTAPNPIVWYRQAADAAAEEAFFRQVRAFKPEALEAHQTWCRAIRP